MNQCDDKAGWVFLLDLQSEVLQFQLEKLAAAGGYASVGITF